MKIQKEAAILGKLQLLTYGGWIDRDSGKAQDEHPVSEEQYGITPWTTSHPNLALQGLPSVLPQSQPSPAVQARSKNLHSQFLCSLSAVNQCLLTETRAPYMPDTLDQTTGQEAF